MTENITTTVVLAVLVSLVVGGWVGYNSHPQAGFGVEQKTAEVAKYTRTKTDSVEPVADSKLPPSELGRPQQVQDRARAGQLTPPEISVFKRLEAGVLLAYRLKPVQAVACLPYARRVAEASASVASNGYRERLHESVQAGYSVGCFAKMTPLEQGAADKAKPEAPRGEGSEVCQAYIEAVANRIRVSTWAKNEKERALADLHNYAAHSRCAL